MRIRRAVVAIVSAAALACGSDPPSGPQPPPPAPPAGSHVIVGAGDIAVCGSSATEQTAALIDRIDGTVFTAGDNAYQNGSAANFRDCYDPTWGRHKHRTRPAPGNHEYESPGAAPYFAYFGANAGPPGLGYYAFDAGPWQVVSLSSSIAAGIGSQQYQWLADVLADRNARCVAAIWHHPMFSSGENGPSTIMRDVWQLLNQARAELVIVGHEHAYERFTPLDGSGRPSPDGVRQIIAGTGGASLYQFVRVAPGSEVRISTHGVLKLTLNAENYQWEFIGLNGSIRDSGTGQCR